MLTLSLSIFRRVKSRPAYFLRSIVVIFFIFLSINTVQSQCVAPSLVFANPVLIGGTDGQVGAIYNFPNVAPGLDVHIEILALGGGSALGEIDNTTQGYFDAWQPYVTAGGNDTSYLDWKITFKKGGTNIDTSLPCLAVTAVDVDGDNATLKEFIRAATPGAYAVDPFTVLTVSFDGTYNTAIGQITTIASIDTNHREAMFQMNFNNINSLIYRNGSISTKADPDVRHTCIYFKPFFRDIVIILPVKLHSFSATVIDQSTRISWMVMEENMMNSYSVQRSCDGNTWTNIDKVYAVNSPGYNSYYVYDQQRPAGTSYYRLQLTDNRGSTSYSNTLQVGNNTGQALSVKVATIIKKNLSLQVTAPVADAYSIKLFSMQGQLIAQKQFTILAGTNQVNADLPQVADALYVVTITNRKGQIVYTNKILRQF